MGQFTIDSLKYYYEKIFSEIGWKGTFEEYMEQNDEDKKIIIAPNCVGWNQFKFDHKLSNDDIFVVNYDYINNHVISAYHVGDLNYIIDKRDGAPLSWTICPDSAVKGKLFCNCEEDGWKCNRDYRLFLQEILYNSASRFNVEYNLNKLEKNLEQNKFGLEIYEYDKTWFNIKNKDNIKHYPGLEFIKKREDIKSYYYEDNFSGDVETCSEGTGKYHYEYSYKYVKNCTDLLAKVCDYYVETIRNLEVFASITGFDFWSYESENTKKMHKLLKRIYKLIQKGNNQRSGKMYI